MRKKIVWLLLFNLGFSNWVFSQEKGSSLGNKIERPRAGSPAHVKVIKKFVKNAAVIGLQPYKIEQEIFYDLLGRVQATVDYSFMSSIFGTDSNVVRTEYSYFGKTKQVNLQKKTIVKTTASNRLEQIEGFEYDQNGQILHLLLFNPIGSVDTVKVTSGHLSAQRTNGQVTDPNSAKIIYDDKPIAAHEDGKWDRQPQIVKVNDMFSYRSLLPHSYGGRKHYSEAEALKELFIVKELNDSGAFLAEQLIKFDKNNQLFQLVTNSNSTNKPTLNLYKYDEAGNETELEAVDAVSGETAKKISYLYNEQGYLVESIWTRKKGKIQRKIKYEYEFYK